MLEKCIAFLNEGKKKAEDGSTFAASLLLGYCVLKGHPWQPTVDFLAKTFGTKFTVPDKRAVRVTQSLEKEKVNKDGKEKDAKNSTKDKGKEKKEKTEKKDKDKSKKRDTAEPAAKPAKKVKSDCASANHRSKAQGASSCHFRHCVATLQCEHWWGQGACNTSGSKCAWPVK